MGFFLTFEGLDGSGKSTQLRKLAAHLEGHGLAVTVTRQPGGTRIGDRIRGLLLDSKTDHLAPQAELGLMFSDRAECIAEVIAPALHGGNIVLCDRFTDSTEAYQGGGRQLGSQPVLELHRLLCNNLQPDLTLLLKVSPEISEQRRAARQSTLPFIRDRIEEASQEFFARVAKGYEAIAAVNPDRVRVVDASGPVETVCVKIWEHVQAALPKAGRW